MIGWALSQLVVMVGLVALRRVMRWHSPEQVQKNCGHWSLEKELQNESGAERRTPRPRGILNAAFEKRGSVLECARFAPLSPAMRLKVLLNKPKESKASRTNNAVAARRHPPTTPLTINRDWPSTLNA